MSPPAPDPQNDPQARAHDPAQRVGVWVFGALGGLATTMIVGARAIARGLSTARGLMTETELARGLPLAPLGGLVFGGHEVREGTLLESAREIHAGTGTIAYPLLETLAADLDAITRDIRPGCLVNAGRGIGRLPGLRPSEPRPLREEVARIEADIAAFRDAHRLERVVAVNLMSTEPVLELGATHMTRTAFESAIDRDRRDVVRPSTLYAYGAARLGVPLIHFTPSNATLVPAVCEVFDDTRTPFMGSDGKTGETLVKSALAPMFKYRNLQVLAWQGYNILGDRDGAVLADDENKRAKVESKDALLTSILGYPLHTHVGIDYVPSLNDLKTAWDFIHFQGFLDHKMSMQFTWQGCDAILAAPLVLDMVRLAELAQRRGESGPMRHLSCFFKRPLAVEQHDLHVQWHLLLDWLARARQTPASS